VGIGLLIVVLTATLGGPAGSAFAADRPAGDAARPTGTEAPHSVTLLTGDRVTLSKDGKIGIQRGKDRAGVVFLTRRVDGHVHVVPSDALSLLRAGRLDSRLFDITTLIEFGYDDRRGDIPLVVTTDPAARSTGTIDGTTVVRQLPAVDGMAVRAAKDDATAVWRSLTGGAAGARTLGAGVSAVWLDGLRKPSLDVSVPQIGAPAAWQAGLEGTGIRVAVLDTGIDATHPDLAGQVGAASNFTEGEEDDADRVGHGTHVASTIAGTGAASDGRYRGVAPKATLLDGKVCVEFGCAESWILAGMQWAADQGADVVNLSLGGGDTPAADPLEQAIDNLTAQHGMLFVVAAGNSGADATIASPASADAAVAVGAVTKTDELADFSSRGPRIDGGLKPDITGPGVDIVAANSKDGFLGEPGEPYTTLSGTSMATPHVAGAAALLAQRHPDVGPAGLKALLMGSAKVNPELNAFAQGAGRVDVARAITQTVSADPPGVGFGRQLWPHADDSPVSRTVTYRNSAASPVSLALSAQGTGPSGQPAPAGFFTLSATSLTVPAGGEASVTITADTRVNGPDGYYTGRLTATGGGGAVVTPFAIDREVESYDVTIRHLDREGAATGDYFTSLVRTDRSGFIDVYDPDGTAEVRVPKGPYALISLVIMVDPDNEEEIPDLAFLAQPKLSVTQARTVTVDARRGRPISVTVPRPDASPVGVDVSAEVLGEDFGAGFSVGAPGFEGFYTAQLGPDRSYPWFRSEVGATLAKVDAEGSSLNSPFVYTLSWRVDGKMVTGFTKRVAPRSLATVRAAHARQGPATGSKFAFPIRPDTTFASAYGLEMTLPHTRTEYYNTEGPLSWQPNMDEYLVTEEDFEFYFSLWGPTKRYRPGASYVEHWNRAVFGPSLADPVSPYEYLTRTGDTMIVAVPLYGDGESRAGFSAFESARVTIYRNGTEVGETSEPFAELEVPRAAGRYRVEMESVRGAPATLSTTVKATWTFRSGHVSGEESRRLPISVVRFAPRVSQHNTAPAGRTYAIPVTVQPQPGSTAKPNAALSVQVSYDDGRTWTTAPVRTVDGVRQVLVQHPDRAGFVSLRASARDAAGNTVEQTIIRAYRIVE
jgi:subtilisin family serine protease